MPKLTAPQERQGSSWQGLGHRAYPEQDLAAARADLMLNAWLGHATWHISPAALGNAYFDWIVHLALAPTKQAAMAEQLGEKLWRWQQYALHAVQPQAPACIEALPQDKRFSDPAWGRWPFNVIAQGFLLQQQWWHRACSGVRGVESHHEQVVTFTARQWLDMLAPSNFLLTNPVVLDATLSSGGVNLLRGCARAGKDALAALGLDEARPGGARVGATLAVTPGKVVLRNCLIELIQYAPDGVLVHSTPLLIVPAWIMKYYILDLGAQNSLVRYLVSQGHTVFMISWKNPTAEDRELSMDDYRQHGIMAALDAICTITGTAAIAAAGYCLGGTLLAIAAARMARDGDSRLASLTLLAAQVDFKEPGELSLFIDESQVSFLEAGMWDQGYLDTRQMAGAFQLLRSNDLIWSRRLRQYLLGLPEAENDLLVWNADTTRMPYRMHSDYLRQLFLHNDLAEGRYMSGGRPVALRDIDIPIFALATLTDHVAPWRSIFKLHLLADTELTFLLTTGGHNAGVVSPPGVAGRTFQTAVHTPGAVYVDPGRWQQDTPQQDGSWWPVWSRWLGDHGGPLVPAPVMGPALAEAPGSYVLQA